jgi:hypothetical protein
MQKLFFSPLGVLLALCATGALFLWIRGAKPTLSSSEYLEKVDSEVQLLEAEVADLRVQSTASQSSLTKERVIRDELLLSKPGEVVIQLESLPSPVAQPSQAERATPWQEWRELLGW